MLSVGCKVTASDEPELGVGEVVGRGNRPGTILVRFYRGCVAFEERQFAEARIQRVVLTEHHRVYVRWNTAWRAGRALGCVDPESTGLRLYGIALPNGLVTPEPIAEDTFHAASDLPPGDPLEVLIGLGHETPFFHKHRSRLVERVIEARRASRDLTGLVSARIELYFHQVEVVRRILQDWRQRYLLCDEVGLGKTIESGCVIRQLLIDDPTARVLVLVPALIAEQWVDELEKRFDILRGGRVSVVAWEELAKKKNVAAGAWGLIVIDEAHHVAADSPGGAQDYRGRLFDSVAALARATPRLLLLSATPVREHEHEFLAMLHLLEPEVYRLDDLAAFRRRLELREPLGNALVGLDESGDGYTLELAAEELRELLPDDARLAQLCSELLTLCRSSPFDQERAQGTIRTIRAHVGECYRFHQRMLKNRRAVLSEDFPEQREVIPWRVQNDQELEAAIEAWRIHVSSSLSSLGAIGTPLEDSFASVFGLLLDALGSSPALLRDLARLRIGELSGIAGGGTATMAGSGAPDLLPGEEPLLRAIARRAAARPPAGVDRMAALGVALARPEFRTMKVVVFVGETRTVRELADHMRADLGTDQVVALHHGLDRDEANDAVADFQHGTARVLVADRRGAEGRNLEFADGLVHFDLPLAPMLIEQRIGRLDRLSRVVGGGCVPCWVLVSDEETGAYDREWYRLLDEGFRIFNSPITDLAVFAEREVANLRRAMLHGGVAALSDRRSGLPARIQEERRIQAGQDLLDAIDANHGAGRDFFESLSRHDRRVEWNRALSASGGREPPGLEFAVTNWLNEVFRFACRSEDGIVNYSVRERDRYSGRTLTLLPARDLEATREFLGSEGTFSRRVACRRQVHFHRLGSPFLDHIADWLARDDRGIAFAMWRQVADLAEEWEGFRLDFVVEPDVDAALEALRETGRAEADVSALRRLAVGHSPPEYQTEFFRWSSGQVQVENDQTAHLEPDYKADPDFNDKNLGGRYAAVIESLHPAEEWASICHAVRARGLELIREDPAFIAACARRADEASRSLAVRAEQLRLGVARLAETDRDLAERQEQALATERLIHGRVLDGIRNPRIRLDAVGFIVLSPRPCPEPTG